MKIYDISMPIHQDMPVYKNKEEKRPKLEIIRDYKNSSAYESRLSLEMHTGTHLDMPLHMLEGGERIQSLDLSKVIRPCKVLDFTAVSEKISKTDLEKKQIQAGDFLLFKTQNSYKEAFDFEFIYLDDFGAAYLLEKGVVGVGIDALGIERAQPNHATHKILLGAEIVILEGLRLSEVHEGEYFLIAPPLLVPEAEAAPVRALLLENFLPLGEGNEIH
ncbi:Kynurenine formamidase [Geosporobacter subterraneus DSM 17957]|uniref:Kynurenine formamidase n=1 Tax=Geosporobacter subterraneus DSM 17957 TaxID=1121919 RepID=A0A1M6F5D5_9FIRM|nr:cyclase family protein [Geosporobacter subterraneus]SHI92872.1 Kynurenine formamidase [Geosporobacter subterraneus DSM 17957]